MKSNLQIEIQAKYDMLGIDPSMPDGEMPKGLQAPDWIHEGPVYEIFLRSFSREGNFTAVSKKLGYLKDLGIKTIWLMPIHPIGRTKRKGKSGSPYAISDHMAINPDYGTKSDFKNLVDAIHDHDMRIIIDMVLNHAAPDHVKNMSYPDMFNSDLQHSPGEWSDIIEFNYNQNDTFVYALDSLIYWINEFGIDGYRCDVAGLVPLKFWENTTDQLFNIKPDLFLLAEWENRALHFNSFHATYEWTMYFLMKDVYESRRSPAVLFKWFEEQQKTYPMNALHFRFTENHDLPRTTQTFGQESLYPYIFFLFSIPGIPLIYNGQELGASKLLSLFDQNSIEWGKRNHKVFRFIKRLIHLRNTNDVFHCNNIEIIQIESDDQILALRKRAGNKLYDFYLNFSSSEYRLNFNRNYNNTKSVRELVENIILKKQDEFVLGSFQSSVFELEQEKPSSS